MGAGAGGDPEAVWLQLARSAAGVAAERGSWVFKLVAVRLTTVRAAAATRTKAMGVR